MLRSLASRAGSLKTRLMSTAAASQSSVMRWAVGGWSFFIVENIVLSQNRSTIIQLLEDDERESKYHALYGTISTAACASIGYAYLFKVRGAKPLLWSVSSTPPLWRLALGFGLQALGLAAMAQSLPRLQSPVTTSAASLPAASQQQQPPQPQQAMTLRAQCPFDFAEAGAGRGVDADESGPRGLARVTRHPGFWSLAAVCLGAAVSVPSVPQAAWLAMPTAVALIGGAHADYRHRRGLGRTLPTELDAVTSNVPFIAMLLGTQGGSAAAAFSALADEVKGSNAAAGASVALIWTLRRVR